MPTAGQIAICIEELAPLSLAAEWDNCGLQVGNPAALVQRVMVAVDLTDRVLQQAVARGVELVIAHHPLLFHPLRSLVAGDPLVDRVGELLRHNMALYAAHTSLDAAPHYGTADALADVLGLVQIQPLLGPGISRPWEGNAALAGELKGRRHEWEQWRVASYGRVGRLLETVSAEALALAVAKSLGVREVTFHGDPAQLVAHAAVVPGSGNDAVSPATEAGCGVLVTGELNHHAVLDALDRGLAVIEVGHLASERPVRARLAQALQRRFPETMVFIAEEPPTGATLGPGRDHGGPA